MTGTLQTFSSRQFLSGGLVSGGVKGGGGGRPPRVLSTTGRQHYSLAQPENIYRRITLPKHTKKKFGRQTDGQTDRQIDGNGKPISSYSRGHERSRKRKSRESADGLDCNTSFAYAREVKTNHCHSNLHEILQSKQH